MIRLIFGTGKCLWKSEFRCFWFSKDLKVLCNTKLSTHRKRFYNSLFLIYKISKIILTSLSLLMDNVPWPIGTSFLKTSWKYLDTCLNVKRIASNLRCSSTSMRSWIFLWPLSNSSFLDINFSFSSLNEINWNIKSNPVLKHDQDKPCLNKNRYIVN